MRINGVNLPEGKRIVISLTYLYGVGLATAKRILRACNINENIKARSLTDEQIAAIRDYLRKQEDIVLESDLRRRRAMDIKRLQDIGCYRGQRHRKGLPCRGQRTHTNAKTRRRWFGVSVKSS